MEWSQSEIELLSPIIEQVQADLEPLEGKNILVLCSAAGEISFRLGEKVKHGKVIGIELNQELLEVARRTAKSKSLQDVVEFLPTEKTHIPFSDDAFDGLVSEFIVYPTSTPTEIGQPEMARVLKSGGKMVLTDVIITKPVPQVIRNELQAIGLDYLCDGTQDDFKDWMTDAGFVHIEVVDFTPVVRKGWEHKRATDNLHEHQKGYSHLLEDSEFRLGNAIFYICIRGEKG